MAELRSQSPRLDEDVPGRAIADVADLDTANKPENDDPAFVEPIDGRPLCSHVCKLAQERISARFSTSAMGPRTDVAQHTEDPPQGGTCWDLQTQCSAGARGTRGRGGAPASAYNFAPSAPQICTELLTSMVRRRPWISYRRSLW